MNILFYFGGFAPVGGIETFCKNLLTYFKVNNSSCALICWGKDSPMLNTLRQDGVEIFRSSWRWGNRWQIPNWLLLPFGLRAVHKADIIIFGKILPTSFIKTLRLFAGAKTQFVFITPYRPLVPSQQKERNRLLEFYNSFD